MLNKKIRKRRKFKKFLIIFFAFAILLTVLFEFYIKPLQDKLMENRAKVLVEARISKIADDVIESKDYDYDKLLIKTESKNKIVTSLSVNTKAVNKLQN